MSQHEALLVFAAPVLWVLTTPAAAQTELYRVDGTAAGDQLGTSLAVVGDLDGDGASEFIIGAPEAGGTGQVVLVHGRSGASLQTFSGSGAGDRFGHSVSALGDIDGDGFGDWIVGAPQRKYEPTQNYGAAVGPGYAVVYSGQTSTALRTHIGPGVDDLFGFCVAGGGQSLDNDSTPDYVVVESWTSKVHVYSGASGALVRSDSFPDSTFSAAIVGDVDGNGKGDYAVGWVCYAGAYTGEVWVVRGGNGGLIWKDDLSPYASEYGHNICAPGDLDGDTVPDVIGGGLDDGRFALNGKGRIRVLSGAGGGLLFEGLGSVPFAYFSAAMTPMGDMDGDGTPEFAVGQPGWGGYSQNTRVYSGVSGSPVVELSPDGATPDAFGGALAAGDVNGDGLTDLLVGARLDDDAGADAGSVTVFTVLTAPTAYCVAEVNSQGCTPSIFSTGTPSVTGNSFRVKAQNVLNNKSGLLFWGGVPKQTSFGTGFKCIAPPTRRTALQNSFGNPPPDDCSGTYAFHWNAAYTAAQGLTAGDDAYCQYWSRDPQSASNTNFTDALAFPLLP
jgi:hypothetical protein